MIIKIMFFVAVLFVSVALFIAFICLLLITLDLEYEAKAWLKKKFERRKK